MKGLSWIAAVRSRVCERADRVQELDNRARPPMAEDQRQGTWLRRSNVQEVDVLPVDSRGELRKLVELGLVLAPVVAGAPVLGQFFQIACRDPAIPADPVDLAGPPDAGQSVAEVIQVFLRDVDSERQDLGVVSYGRDRLLLSLCSLATKQLRQPICCTLQRLPSGSLKKTNRPPGASRTSLTSTPRSASSRRAASTSGTTS
jgi:hypothetical protein